MTLAEFVVLVDGLEDRATSYVYLEDVIAASGTQVQTFIAEAILLIDHRTRADGTPVTVCRLNRRHPLVAKLTAW